jgi:hypothetical protein
VTCFFIRQNKVLIIYLFIFKYFTFCGYPKYPYFFEKPTRIQIQKRRILEFSDMSSLKFLDNSGSVLGSDLFARPNATVEAMTAAFPLFHRRLASHPSTRTSSAVEDDPKHQAVTVCGFRTTDWNPNQTRRHLWSITKPPRTSDLPSQPLYSF